MLATDLLQMGPVQARARVLHLWGEVVGVLLLTQTGTKLHGAFWRHVEGVWIDHESRAVFSQGCILGQLKKLN